MTLRTAAQVGLTWALAALALGAAPAASAEGKPVIRKVHYWHTIVLPASMQRALRTYDPTFAVWSEAKYDPRLVQIYPFSPRQAPFAVVGDFNGDGALDVVLDGHSKTDDLLLCVLSDGSSFRVLELRKAAVRPGDRLFLDAFLWLQPPGTITPSHGLGPEPLDLKTDAFRITSEEKAATLHYFQNGQFHEYVTGD